MNSNEKEKLILEWKQLRGNFFNRFDEDNSKFEKAYGAHPLYSSVVEHFDKNFMQVNQVAESAIDIYMTKTDSK